MHARSPYLVLVSALATLCAAGAAVGQQAGSWQETRPPEQSAIRLIFEREVFLYPAQGRRDPFTSLVGRADLGPRFESLRLRGIIYSSEPGASVVLLVDGEGAIYRLRQGDTIGRARIIEIGERRVVFAVDQFGVVRQEVLELARTSR